MEQDYIETELMKNYVPYASDSMYKCPKCDAKFLVDAKFCNKCGCNLELEFIENPICPKCEKTFSTGTAFCNVDGAKLVSPEKMIPRCVKCGKEYSDGTKFCPRDGGKVIPEALRKGLDLDKGKDLINEQVGKGKELFDKIPKNQKYMIFIGIVAIVFILIVLPSGSMKKDAKKYAKLEFDCSYDNTKTSEKSCEKLEKSRTKYEKKYKEIDRYEFEALVEKEIERLYDVRYPNAKRKY